jgi:hypothetical protein
MRANRKLQESLGMTPGNNDSNNKGCSILRFEGIKIKSYNPETVKIIDDT